MSTSPFRYYNLYLTYSNYYRVPRSYLSGYDGATKAPLPNPTDIFSDISADYREKTVTIEPFPFPTSDSPIQVQMASVHPCRHAETMKRIFEIMEKRKERKLKELEGKDDTTEEGEGWEEVHAATAEAAEGEAEGDELRVDQYMVVFVKFLAGVMPGVEMDYTMGM